MVQMKRTKNSPLLLVLVLLVPVFVAFSTIPVEARKHHGHTKKHKPNKHHKGHNGASGHGNSPNPDVTTPTPAPAPVPDPTGSGVFDVMSFGAKGDGVSDDSKALVAAWQAACRVASATVQVPYGFRFLIGAITLQGPCMPHLVLQIDGTVLAPGNAGAWPKSSLLQWINFKWVHGFTIQGSGSIDGQGSNWWTPQVSHIKKKSNHIPNMKPTAIRFYASYNVTVEDIKIVNSPLCHLKFDSSSGVKVNNITISSPEDSPNTDGIHLQNTRDVEIQHSDIACGDDCVSIQTGCSNIHIHHINCGPGHGISIGGLGKDKTVACVSDVVVDQVTIQNTMSGVRIKTWQGGIGHVKNITFSNIQVVDVKVPIIIDQYYCDKKACKNQTGAVAVSGVRYDKIIGTFSAQPIRLACSNAVPCVGVDLVDIELTPSPSFGGRFRQALCWNSYGKSQAPLVPSSIDYCLRRDGGSLVKGIERSREQSNVCY